MSKNSFHFPFLVILGALSISSVTPAFAQSYFSMIWGNSITGEDFKQLEDATSTLLKRTPISKRTSENWRNDADFANQPVTT
jgi:hypothetical protein